MERIKQILSNEKSQTNVNRDLFVPINIDDNQRLLPSNEINSVVNVAEQFDKERQSCTSYRLVGTINSLASNPLFNLKDPNTSDDFTWSAFNTLNVLDRSYPSDNDIDDDGDLTYSNAIKSFLKEKNGWFGYFNPDITQVALCQFFDMEPKRERFSFLPDNKPFYAGPQKSLVKNWELTITYPKSVNTGHTMVIGGLLIVDKQPAIESTKSMTAFGMPCSHNLVAGDSVRIINTNGYNGIHTIVRVGLDNGDLKGNYFVVDVPNSAGTITNNSRIKRVVNGIDSTYYFRLFRKIKTKSTPVIETDDYEVYQPVFSESLFNDKITQYVFNEDIDVSDLTDNLGRPLSELYLTIIKTDSNGLFGNISSGIETPFIENLTKSNTLTFLRDVPVISRIHSGGVTPFQTHTPLESKVTINNNNNGPNNIDFYGDLVEYNVSELIEVVLAPIQHRFNTINRETPAVISSVVGPPIGTSLTAQTTQTTLGPRQEGYFYQPHQLIRIREFSAYIEEGTVNTFDLPDYAVNIDGRYLWRELINIGLNESNAKALDYPFLNGVHYMYNNVSFNVKRQDQFANWGLYHGTFPADPIGRRMTDKFKINTTENDC